MHLPKALRRTFTRFRMLIEFLFVIPSGVRARKISLETMRNTIDQLETTLSSLPDNDPQVQELRVRLTEATQQLEELAKRAQLLEAKIPPSLVGRFRFVFREDKFLLISTIVGLIISTLSLIFSLMSFMTMRAFGADISTLQIGSPKDTVRYFILAVVSIAFFVAFGMLGLSTKNDVRKIAADMIKTILGVYLGMATKLAD